MMENANRIVENIIVGRAEQARKELVEEMKEIVQEWKQGAEKDIEAKVLIFQQAIGQLQGLTKDLGVEHTAIKNEIIEAVASIETSFQGIAGKIVENQALGLQHSQIHHEQATIHLQDIAKQLIDEQAIIKNEIIQSFTNSEASFRDIVETKMTEVRQRQVQLEIKLDKIIELINENEKGTVTENARSNLQQAKLLMWIQGAAFMVLVGIALVLSRSIL